MKDHIQDQENDRQMFYFAQDQVLQVTQQQDRHARLPTFYRFRLIKLRD